MNIAIEQEVSSLDKENYAPIRNKPFEMGKRGAHSLKTWKGEVKRAR